LPAAPAAQAAVISASARTVSEIALRSIIE
jgi:hypothetical protein